jgi:hypothetical protein
MLRGCVGPRWTGGRGFVAAMIVVAVLPGLPALRAAEPAPAPSPAGAGDTAAAVSGAPTSTGSDASVASVTAAAPAPALPPPLFTSEIWAVPGAVVDAVREVGARPVGERMEAASRPLLGKRYVNEANGEGAGIDPDPPARYDAFDCLTFVEEVLALALAGDPLHAPALRNALRWDGAPQYENRRHFMEASWVPASVAGGLLEDITGRVGHPRTLRKDVSQDTWRRWGRRGLFQLPDVRLPVGTYTLRYLDLREAVASASRIPPGSVVITLRQPREWVPIVTTHISIVVSDGTRTVMRHATRMGAQEVRDDPVDWYLRHLSTYVNWRVLGVAVYFPREQGPRVSALSPSPVPPVRFPELEGDPPPLEEPEGDPTVEAVQPTAAHGALPPTDAPRVESSKTSSGSDGPPVAVPGAAG